MRFLSTTLLLSVLSTTALTAPIRVVVVEKVSTEKLDDFFRSLRVGHAAAAAAGAATLPVAGGAAMNGHDAPSSDELHALPFPIDFSIKPEPRPAVSNSNSNSNSAPMTPDQEFDTFQSLHVSGECRDASSMRVKWETIADQIRQWLGMALVSRSPLCDTATIVEDRPAPMWSKFEQVDPKKMVPPPVGFVPSGRVMPCHNNHAAAAMVSVSGGPAGIHVAAARPPMRGTYWMHRMRPKSFSGRIQRALNSLTPFESGVVAFVVGCGLGVLVRMILVFIILGVRMWKCSQKRRAGQVRLGEEEDEEKYGDEIVGVVLFDAESIKAASVDNVSVYQEKV